MRALLSLLAISILLTLATAGCRPSGPTEEMGTVVQEVPAVEGADEPYVIPELGPSPSEAKEAGKAEANPAAKPATKPQSNTNPKADDGHKG